MGIASSTIQEISYKYAARMILRHYLLFFLSDSGQNRGQVYIQMLAKDHDHGDQIRVMNSNKMNIYFILV